MARIDWAFDDLSLLSWRAGVLRIYDVHAPTNVREVAAHGALDVRWHGDGRIVAVESHGWRQWTRTGEPCGQATRRYSRRALAAAIAHGGERFVGIGEFNQRTGIDVYVASIEGELVWTLAADTHRADVYGRASASLSGDGTIVAIGFRGRDSSPGQLEFVAIEIATDRIVDRGTIRVVNVTEVTLALATTGDRMVVSGSESLGAIRLGRGDAYARDDVQPSAVALDDTRALAAFAFQTIRQGARGRLRVDYLSHASDGSSTIEVLDTLTLDPALPDIVALAFSRDSRYVACLASTGAIEIVQVP